MKSRLVVMCLLAALAAALVAGCGGSDSSSGKDPAEAAPPDSTVFIQASIRPSGEAADNIDALAEKVAGVEDVGGLLVEEIEKAAAGEGEKFDFEKEVEPWLGESGAIFMHEYDGENFESIAAALQVEDEGEAEKFIEDHADEGEETTEEGSYEGVDFKQMEDGTTFGFTEGLLLFGEAEANFKEAVDALNGENLATQSKFEDASGEEADGAVAGVYVDIGSLIEEAGEEIPAESQKGFELMGIEPKDATAFVSLVPNSENIEMDVTSNLAGGAEAGGDASSLLGSLPSGSIFAAATPEFGKAIEQVVDTLDEQGIPGELEPGELKKALKAQGIDIESILGSFGDLGFFVEGNSERNIGGAVVIEATNATEASNTVKNLGLLLRSSTPGVTAYDENGASGFTIPNDELGGKPIVVAVAGGKIAIGLGPKSIAAALTGKGGELADDPQFKEAQSALGSTPISAYVSGASALTLIDAVASPLEAEELSEAKPYLEKVGYLAIGASSDGKQSSAKLILGFTE